MISLRILLGCRSAYRHLSKLVGWRCVSITWMWVSCRGQLHPKEPPREQRSSATSCLEEAPCRQDHPAHL